MGPFGHTHAYRYRYVGNRVRTSQFSKGKTQITQAATGHPQQSLCTTCSCMPFLVASPVPTASRCSTWINTHTYGLLAPASGSGCLHPAPHPLHTYAHLPSDRCPCYCGLASPRSFALLSALNKPRLAFTASPSNMPYAARYSNIKHLHLCPLQHHLLSPLQHHQHVCMLRH